MKTKAKLILAMSVLTAGVVAAGATGTFAWFTTNRAAQLNYTSVTAQKNAGNLDVVMGLASAICWVVNEYILMPLGLGFLQTIAYILVIAVLVQFVEMFLKKAVPSLYSALGIYLPLITTNCAVLGVVLLNTQYSFNFLQSVVYGITGGIGFLVAICLFASVREKLEFADYPECFEGFPICLVSAGLLALAFMGFSGMKIGG